MTKIKICGLSRLYDTGYINEAMSDYVGFVFFERSHHNVVTQWAAQLRKSIHPSIPAIGISVNAPQEQTISLCCEGVIQTVQLYGGESVRYVGRLKALIPGMPIWRAFRVHTPEDLTAARQNTADLILLDNGYGAGETLDQSPVSGMTHPFLLTRGLTPQNAPQATARFTSYAADISFDVKTEKQEGRDEILAVIVVVHGIGSKDTEKPQN